MIPPPVFSWNLLQMETSLPLGEGEGEREGVGKTVDKSRSIIAQGSEKGQTGLDHKLRTTNLELFVPYRLHRRDAGNEVGGENEDGDDDQQGAGVEAEDEERVEIDGYTLQVISLGVEMDQFEVVL